MKKEIQSTPQAKKVNVQSEQERTARLTGWRNLLEKLSYVEIYKFGNEVYDGYISDNAEVFSNSIIVAFLAANLEYHDEAYLFLYPMFQSDGTVEIDKDENVHYYPGLIDPTVTGLLELYDKFPSGGTWKEGYLFIAKMIQKIFGDNNIPKIPCNEDK